MVRVLSVLTRARTGSPRRKLDGKREGKGGRSVMSCLHSLSYEVSVPIEYPELLSWMPIELSTKPCGELRLWQIIVLPILAMYIGGSSRWLSQSHR
ncbi:hypothetical protein BDV24DRAFT_134542 [Aspergillus arachidicola]|uniref:Uncharacterized protein n=1 Tax=Aspergillus arachidicola TaxID=656916 RepID=A0A5N6Y4D8_9EURO|nr:hypothetical protein BDV24DRAFT_134542 [Aspergillus arachidicola]